LHEIRVPVGVLGIENEEVKCMELVNYYGCKLKRFEGERTP
jgi:hypothetical protein